MLKQYFFPLFFILLVTVSACNEINNTSAENYVLDTLDTAARTEAYFPVSDFLLGQIAEIKKIGVNPLMIIKQGTQLDSTWIKVEELEAAFKDFTDPIIDSNTVKSWYKQTTFNDQTINKFTFSYAPTINLPAGFPFRTWNVYVSPNTNMVTSVYLVKQAPGMGLQYLTWNTDKNCTIQLLKDDVLISETNIIWNFSENDK